MKIFKYSIVLILLLFFSISFSQETGEECTIGVAAGRATDDGRALIWKTRDNSSAPDNELVFNTSYNISFLEIVNAGKTYAWMGLNEDGFAILNSLAQDLKAGSSGYSNGSLMREALGTCSNIGEFRVFLDNTNADGRKTRGNFAVLDSDGAASMFEIDQNTYWEYDANDTTVTAQGYIIRTNFAENGDGFSGSGYERFNRSQDLIGNFYAGDSLNYRSILRYQMRDFSDYNSDPVDVPFAGTWSYGRPYGYIYTYVSICRSSSVSTAAIQGILPGESEKLSTMWTILGNPAASIAAPFWPAGATPNAVNGSSTAPICDVALNIKSKLFDYTENSNYIDSYKLLDGQGDGIWIDLFAAEDSIFISAENSLAGWRDSSFAVSDLLTAQNDYAEYALASLDNIYNDLITSLPELAANGMPGDFLLKQNYPNPFNMSTKIEFTIPSAGLVKIKIYDINGREVSRLIEQNLNAGNHTLNWNAVNTGELSSGIYLCRLSFQGEKMYETVRKLTLIK